MPLYDLVPGKYGRFVGGVKLSAGQTQITLTAEQAAWPLSNGEIVLAGTQPPPDPPVAPVLDTDVFSLKRAGVNRPATALQLKEYATGVSVAVTWSTLPGKPTAFTPALHVHAISDITNLQIALDAKQPLSEKGQANGYAGLDGSGKVPAVQLPSFVDDVLEYANLAAFPVTGESGKQYLALDTNKIFRWSGSVYVEISPSPGSTDSVTEGVTNLYFTAPRAAAAAPVQSVAGKAGAVTLVKADVGLANVDNTSDANKPVSTAVATALAGKAATAHAHAIADVTGLQGALDAKADGAATTTALAGKADAAATTTALATKADAAATTNALAAKANLIVPVDTKTANYTVVAGDNGRTIRMNGATALTVTLPADAAVGTNVMITQAGAGQVTIAAAAGGSLRQPDSFTKTAKQHAAVYALVVENIGGTAAAWLLSGAMAA